MKIKHLFVAAAAIVMGLTSCSNDEGTKPSGEKNLFVQFTQLSGTRADVPTDYEGTKPDFNSGHLFFTTSTGDVKRYIRVNNSNVTGTLSPAALQAGTLVESLSADVTKIYLYGNIDNAPLSISNISEMEDIVIELSDERDLNYGVSNVTLTGGGQIEQLASTEYWNGDPNFPYDYKCKFTITPMIARVEIQKLTMEESYDDQGVSKGTQHEFQLKSIYINNYHSDFTLANTPYSPVVNWLQDIPSYQAKDVDATNGKYEVADRKYLYDDKKLNGTFGLMAAPAKTVVPESTGAKPAWAYNVFAYGEPHIVFHFEKVKKSDGTPFVNNNPDAFNSDDAYLTVTRFVKVGTDEQVSLEGGHIYRLTNLRFNDGDLGETPEPPGNDKRDVYVEVEVMEWEVVNVDGKFD